MRKLAVSLALPVLALSVLAIAACAGRASNGPNAAPGAPVCGQGKPVGLRDPAAPSGSLPKLFGTHYAELVFVCPSDEPCSLPADRQIELTVEPHHDVACAFDSCRVPYLASLPFARDAASPCPSVLWSHVKVHLKSDSGTLDEQAEDVDLLGTARGEAFLRLVVDSPAALRAPASTPETRAVLLDVQLELSGDDLRGQVSALVAPSAEPLSAEPRSELHFAPLWTATWQTPLSLSPH